MIFYHPREQGSWELGRIFTFYQRSGQDVLNVFITRYLFNCNWCLFVVSFIFLLPSKLLHDCLHNQSLLLNKSKEKDSRFLFLKKEGKEQSWKSLLVSFFFFFHHIICHFPLNRSCLSSKKRRLLRQRKCRESTIRFVGSAKIAVQHELHLRHALCYISKTKWYCCICDFENYISMQMQISSSALTIMTRTFQSSHHRYFANMVDWVCTKWSIRIK